MTGNGVTVQRVLKYENVDEYFFDAVKGDYLWIIVDYLKTGKILNNHLYKTIHKT